MSDSIIYAVIVAGLSVSIALSVYIIKQLKGIRLAKEKQAAALAKVEAETQKQRDYLIESIHVIANAMVHDERMTLTEGTIRISVLLDNLLPQLKQDPRFSVITTVHEKTRHIPYLDAWKSLDKQEQRTYLKEMKAVEREHGDALVSAAKELSSYPFTKHFH